MVHDDTKANELTARLEEESPLPPLLRGAQQEPKMAQVEVAVQGGRVVLLLNGAGITMRPEQALHLATVIRTKANEILHAEHLAAAKIRREQKAKRRG